MIILKTPEEIALMHEAGKVVEDCIFNAFFCIDDALKQGNKITKLDVEKIMIGMLGLTGMEPAFYNFHGYPSKVCISINDEIVHGIPNETIIKNGDLVTIDFGTINQSWNADAALTRIVGSYDENSPKYREIQRLLNYCNDALDAGIVQCRVGKTLGDITAAISSAAAPGGYGILNNYTGHGIGQEMHEPPNVYNNRPYPNGYAETKLRKGMVLCLEPMLCMSRAVDTVVLEDKWTIATTDGSLNVHSEAMIAITDGDPLILADPRSKYEYGRQKE
jgi:methionyl aminopeptidase